MSSNPRQHHIAPILIFGARHEESHPRGLPRMVENTLRKFQATEVQCTMDSMDRFYGLGRADCNYASVDIITKYV